MKHPLFLLPPLLLLAIVGGLLTIAFRTFGTARAADPLPPSENSVRWRLTYQEYGYRFERFGSRLRVDLFSPKEKGTYARLYHPGIRFVPGETYTLRFRARADRHRRFLSGAQWSPFARPGEDSEQWGWLSAEWATYEYTFTAQKEFGTIFFTIGRTPGVVEFADIAVTSTSDLLWIVAWFLRDHWGILALGLLICLGPLLMESLLPSHQASLLPRFLLVAAIATISAEYLSWRISVLALQHFALAGSLFVAELLGVLHILGLQITLLWAALRRASPLLNRSPEQTSTVPLSVYILIPTVDEGVEILTQTLRSTVAAAASYQQKNSNTPISITVCNDGRVAGYGGWQVVEKLAQSFEPGLVGVLTRQIPGGAKAGNLENARRELGINGNTILVVLDADQRVEEDFLETVLAPLLADPKAGWVQLPQWYQNQENLLARTAQEQQAIFYDLICPARGPLNAAFICGTNVAIRAAALDEIGGFPQDSVTEDTAASIRMHARWRGIYLPLYKVSGLGPMDLPAYFTQQRRWAVGTLELLRRHFWADLILGRSGLDLAQRIQYLLALSHYLRGFRDALFFLAPVVFLLTGVSPLTAIGAISLLWHQVPMVIIALGAFHLLARGKTTLAAESLAFAAFPVYLGALLTVLVGRRIRFAVTPKQRRVASGWPLWPQTVAFGVGVLALVSAAGRIVTDLGTALNSLWLVYYLAQFVVVFNLQRRLAGETARKPAFRLVFSLLFLLLPLCGCSRPTGTDTTKIAPDYFTGTPSPLTGQRFYVDPDSLAAIWWAENRIEFPGEAALLRRMSQVPTAYWLSNGDTVRQEIERVTEEARAAGRLAVFVLYHIPNRDKAGGYSAGGAKDAATYRRWVDDIVSALKDTSTVILIEPDALPDISLLAPMQRKERVALLRYAVSRLSGAGNMVYLDAGHSRWLRVDVAASLLKECGIAKARGFSLNVSNFQTLDESVAYAKSLSAFTGGKTAVIDTSRCGNGPATDGAWCNPPGRALGPLPTTATAFPIDALLWVKRPWESDGDQNGAPVVGALHRTYALELAYNARWKANGEGESP